MARRRRPPQSAGMRVLVVDDSERVRKTLASGLHAHGLTVDTASDGREALHLIETLPFDVVVLDLMMPTMDGVELLRALKGRATNPRILVLSARDQVQDRVDALNLGADDYLVKPFAFDELLARVRALTRRQPSLAPDVHNVADLEVDLGARAVKRAGRAIELTGKEFELLECLVRHEGNVVDRATITGYVWDDNHDPFANAVEVLVRRLRAKIDDPFDQKLIHTIRAAGYRFGP
jgi:DNA-binding response OmpR family regulator